MKYPLYCISGYICVSKSLRIAHFRHFPCGNVCESIIFFSKICMLLKLNNYVCFISEWKYVIKEQSVDLDTM